MTVKPPGRKPLIGKRWTQHSNFACRVTIFQYCYVWLKGSKVDLFSSAAVIKYKLCDLCPGPGPGPVSQLGQVTENYQNYPSNDFVDLETSSVMGKCWSQGHGGARWTCWGEHCFLLGLGNWLVGMKYTNWAGLPTHETASKIGIWKLWVWHTHNYDR